MTIAACYISPEGVVLGADSTSTYHGNNGPHYFNHAQKLFELGQGATVAVVTWGLGGLGVQSYRGLLAELSDELIDREPASVLEIAERWAAKLSPIYDGSELVVLYRRLAAKAPHDPNDSASRSAEEEAVVQVLRADCYVGFCFGGYVLPTRDPVAYEVGFDPESGIVGPTAINRPGYRFWGAPNMIQRLIFGCDDGLKCSLLLSGHWTGTAGDLDGLIQQHHLAHPIVPIRDAIDFLHICMASTIKALKFSHLSQICGGPIELAVITADRPFRWVRHKEWDSAITEGET